MHLLEVSGSEQVKSVSVFGKESEVKYKGEILPGEQPAIMDRELFDAVQQKLTDQWSHRNHAKSKSDHLLMGLLYDDAGHRMIPTHATKAGIRYRYYVSLPHLKGER